MPDNKNSDDEPTLSAKELERFAVSPAALARAGEWANAFKPVMDNLAKQQLAPVSAALEAFARSTVKVEFTGISEAVKLIAQHVAALERVVYPGLARIGEQFRKYAFPENLASLDGVLIRDVLAVGRDEGIALFGVPNAHTAKGILSAPTPEARRSVLGRNLGRIASDCRNAVDGIRAPEVRKHVALLQHAADAALAGHTEAAQALATCMLDAAMYDLVGAAPRRLARARKKDPDLRAEAELLLREALVMLPLVCALVPYEREKGDPIPRTYSRHATVHGGGSHQYSKRNTAQALLLATSLLLYADEVRSGRLR